MPASIRRWPGSPSRSAARSTVRDRGPRPQLRSAGAEAMAIDDLGGARRGRGRRCRGRNDRRDDARGPFRSTRSAPSTSSWGRSRDRAGIIAARPRPARRERRVAPARTHRRRRRPGTRSDHSLRAIPCPPCRTVPSWNCCSVTSSACGERIPAAATRGSSTASERTSGCAARPAIGVMIGARRSNVGSPGSSNAATRRSRRRSRRPANERRTRSDPSL